MVRVIFVCKGNICRSPMAQGVFKEIVKREGLEGEIYIDSAGTHPYHLGKPPDERAQKSAVRHSIDISGQRARYLMLEDCRKFDYIVVMDKKNRRHVKQKCKDDGAAEVRLFLDYAPALPERQVPDPYYYDDPEGFEVVMDLVKAASEGLLEDIRRRHISKLSGDLRAPASYSSSLASTLLPKQPSTLTRFSKMWFRLWRTCAATVQRVLR